MTAVVVKSIIGALLLLVKGIAIIILAGVAIFVFIILREVAYAIHEENKRRIKEKSESKKQ